jgi:hypothetical protein
MASFIMFYHPRQKKGTTERERKDEIVVYSGRVVG